MKNFVSYLIMSILKTILSCSLLHKFMFLIHIIKIVQLTDLLFSNSSLIVNYFGSQGTLIHQV